jgi:hypothetical protein
VDAANRGDFTCVVADVHPGANPLAQAVFGARHPDRAQFLEAWASDVGSPQVVLVPSPARGMTSRLMGCVTRRGDLHVLGAPGAAVPAGYRRVPVDELFIEDENITDQGCTFSAPITDLLAIPMMRAAVQNYDPFGATGHTPRLSVGRTVLNRETWRLPAAELNTERDAIVAWAARQGMPRRVFVHSPLERKPIYVDLDSTVLTRILARMIRRAAANDPREPVTFTEMLPTPDCCWLEDAAGARHTSELRLVCVDTTRRTATCADRG